MVEIVEVKPCDGDRAQHVKPVRRMLDRDPVVVRLVRQRNEASEAAGFVLQLAQPPHMVDAIRKRLEVAEQHRASTPAAELVPHAVDVKVLLRRLLAARDPVANLLLKNLRTTAGQRVEAQRPELGEHLRHRFFGEPGEVQNLDRGEALELQPLIDRLGTLFRDVKEIDMALDGLVSWSKAQRTIQPAEGWQSFSDWIDNHNPRMSYTVARNLFIASQTSQDDLSWAQLVRRQARARMKTLLEPGAVLCMPTTRFCAPLTGLPVSQTDELRMRISVLCCHGGLTGVPQVSIPGTTIREDNAPIGLSIVAGHHRDSELLAVAAALEAIS